MKGGVALSAVIRREMWHWRGAMLFAMLGLAIGPGNIWRFPYLVYEYGGGAFLIAYMFALLTFGIPGVIIEFGLGNRSQAAPPMAFKWLNKSTEWVGWWVLLISALLMAYVQPIYCLIIRYIGSAATLAWGADPGGYLWGTALQLTGGPGELASIPLGLLISWAIEWAIIFAVLWAGIKVLGRVASVMMPVFFGLLVMFIVRGMISPGAIDGWALYLTPHMDQLLNPHLWLAAYGQVGSSLGIGLGCWIVVGSLKRLGSDTNNNVLVTSFGNSFISFIAGFAVFSTLGYLAYLLTVPIDEVVAGGIGLAFISYPTLANLIPTGEVFAVLFFLLFAFGAISSFMIMPLGMLYALKEKFKMSHLKATSIAVGVPAVLGLWFICGHGFHWLDIVDHWFGHYTLPLAALTYFILVGWSYGAARFRGLVNEGSEVKVGLWWDICIKFISPIFLVVLLVLGIIEEAGGLYGGYPLWALLVGGWGITVALPIGAYALSKLPQR